jgi:hypothetical protein
MASQMAANHIVDAKRLDGRETMLDYSIHARERVRDFVAEEDLDRLALLACAAAEASDGWHRGAQFDFEIEEKRHVYPGMELSAFIVLHLGTHYELRFYYGPMAETISTTCSWDRPM